MSARKTLRPLAPSTLAHSDPKPARCCTKWLPTLTQPAQAPAEQTGTPPASGTMLLKPSQSRFIAVSANKCRCGRLLCETTTATRNRTPQRPRPCLYRVNTAPRSPPPDPRHRAPRCSTHSQLWDRPPPPRSSPHAQDYCRPARPGQAPRTSYAACHHRAMVPPGGSGMPQPMPPGILRPQCSLHANGVHARDRMDTLADAGRSSSSTTAKRTAATACHRLHVSAGGNDRW